MRALLIGPVERDGIATVRAWAQAHPVSRRELAQMVELDRPPVGDDPRHACLIPEGYRCVYSVEDHPVGLCRHLSVSVLDPDPARPLPSPEAITMLMTEFGFVGSLPMSAARRAKHSLTRSGWNRAAR